LMIQQICMDTIMDHIETMEDHTETMVVLTDTMEVLTDTMVDHTETIVVLTDMVALTETMVFHIDTAAHMVIMVAHMVNMVGHTDMIMLDIQARTITIMPPTDQLQLLFLQFKNTKANQWMWTLTTQLDGQIKRQVKRLKLILIFTNKSTQELI